MMTRTGRVLTIAVISLWVPARGFAQSTTTTIATTTTTSTSTTTSTLACDLTPTFESILCRESALVTAITLSQEFHREKFRGLLLRQMGLLQKRTMKAEQKLAEGKRGPAKNWAKGAAQLLKVFQQRLDSLTGKNSISRAGRDALLGIATPIRTDLGVLRAMF